MIIKGKMTILDKESNFWNMMFRNSKIVLKAGLCAVFVKIAPFSLSDCTHTGWVASLHSLLTPLKRCDYYQSLNKKRDESSARHNMKRHKKTCDQKYTKGLVYIPPKCGKRGGKYVPESQKGEFLQLLKFLYGFANFASFN